MQSISHFQLAESIMFQRLLFGFHTPSNNPSLPTDRTGHTDWGWWDEGGDSRQTDSSVSQWAFHIVITKLHPRYCHLLLGLRDGRGWVVTRSRPGLRARSRIIHLLTVPLINESCKGHATVWSVSLCLCLSVKQSEIPLHVLYIIRLFLPLPKIMAPPHVRRAK